MKGKACTVMGNPDKKHTYTFIDDFGKALVVLSQHEDAFGRAWHVPNDATVTTREFVETAYRLAGFPANIQTMGKTMLRIGGLFIPQREKASKCCTSSKMILLLTAVYFQRSLA